MALNVNNIRNLIEIPDELLHSPWKDYFVNVDDFFSEPLWSHENLKPVQTIIQSSEKTPAKQTPQNKKNAVSKKNLNAIKKTLIAAYDKNHTFETQQGIANKLNISVSTVSKSLRDLKKEMNFEEDGLNLKNKSTKKTS